MTWDDFDYWRSGEWQVVEEHLDDLDRAGKLYNPKRENLFASLDAVDFENVKVVIVGQDPYPNSEHSTGIAFDIPPSVKEWPATLVNIMTEYVNDLHYPLPATGSLIKWTKEGVLLWNATPSCDPGKPGSHIWDEWQPLTNEIITKLSERGVVFVLLGGRARGFASCVKEPSVCIELSHPSPLGHLKTRSPFTGSRMFTTINSKLTKLGKEPINWKL